MFRRLPSLELSFLMCTVIDGFFHLVDNAYFFYHAISVSTDLSIIVCFCNNLLYLLDLFSNLG